MKQSNAVFDSLKFTETEFIDPVLQLISGGYVRLIRWDFSSISSPFWRIYWNNQSGVHLFHNRSYIPMEPHQVYIIPPNTIYGTRLDHPVMHFYLHFRTPHPLNKAPAQILTLPATSLLKRNMKEICRMFRYPSPRPPRMSILCHAVAAYCLQQFPIDAFPPLTNLPEIKQVITAMEQHISDPLDNSQLAQMICMSTNVFTRWFKKIVGQSPQSYYTDLRIETACMLLHQTSKRIEEIANATGFCDRYHFSRVFTRVRFISPAKFRHMRHAPPLLSSIRPFSR